MTAWWTNACRDAVGGGTYGNGCKGMHCQRFTMKEAIFKAGVILIACKVWAKRGVSVCLPNMGGVVPSSSLIRWKTNYLIF
jgi:hypothetical protein